MVTCHGVVCVSLVAHRRFHLVELVSTETYGTNLTRFSLCYVTRCAVCDKTVYFVLTSTYLLYYGYVRTYVFFTKKQKEYVGRDQYTGKPWILYVRYYIILYSILY